MDNIFAKNLQKNNIRLVIAKNQKVNSVYFLLKNKIVLDLLNLSNF